MTYDWLVKVYNRRTGTMELLFQGGGNTLPAAFKALAKQAQVKTRDATRDAVTLDGALRDLGAEEAESP